MAPRITSHLINRDCTFINQMYPPLVFVVHRTAGHVNVQQLYDYWQSTCISSHFGISYDGYDPHDIWQFVNLWDGSGANCCPNFGNCAPFFNNRGGNANTYTISVEVCTPNTGNNGLMTAAQVESLVYLIQTVCAELGIPVDQYSTYWNGYEDSHTWIGANGGIGMHRDVDSRNKGMCPGDPYYQGQMDDIIALVRGGQVPSGGSDYVANIEDKNGWIIRLWESFYQRLNQSRPPGTPPLPIPRRDTGIFNEWRQLALNGVIVGGVMSEEWQFDGKMFQDGVGWQGYFDLTTHDIQINYTG
jgi:hypothetical protein